MSQHGVSCYEHFWGELAFQSNEFKDMNPIDFLNMHGRMDLMKVCLTGLAWLSLRVAPILAGDAVDGLNGKLDFSGGTMDAHWGDNLAGSITLPVAPHLGLQTDGLFTHAGSQNFAGGGLHCFWRDSEKGLLGLTAAGLNGNFLYGLQGGVEAEYYLKRFTLGANLGAATLQYHDPAPFINTRPTDVYATVSLGWYPADNLMILAAGSRLFGNNLGELLLEYQTPVNSLSCFANFARGDHGYDHALFGLRYYFGREKSLMRRHREDDPPNLLSSLLSGFGTYGAKYNRAMHAFASDNTGSGYTPSGGGYGAGQQESPTSNSGSQDPSGGVGGYPAIPPPPPSGP